MSIPSSPRTASKRPFGGQRHGWRPRTPAGVAVSPVPSHLFAPAPCFGLEDGLLTMQLAAFRMMQGLEDAVAVTRARPLVLGAGGRRGSATDHDPLTLPEFFARSLLSKEERAQETAIKAAPSVSASFFSPLHTRTTPASSGPNSPPQYSQTTPQNEIHHLHPLPRLSGRFPRLCQSHRHRGSPGRNRRSVPGQRDQRRRPSCSLRTGCHPLAATIEISEREHRKQHR